jgi:hypothetical protein
MALFKRNPLVSVVDLGRIVKRGRAYASPRPNWSSRRGVGVPVQQTESLMVVIIVEVPLSREQMLGVQISPTQSRWQWGIDWHRVHPTCGGSV